MNLLELVVSMALTVVLSGAIMSLVSAAQAIARQQPEVSDLQQRARIARQALEVDLRDAGAGLDAGAFAGPLVRYFPPVGPSSDGGLTLWTLTRRAARAVTAAAVDPTATVVALEDAAGCPPGAPACGFVAGTSAIVFGAGGCRSVVRVAAVSADALFLASPIGGCGFAARSAVAEGSVRTYRVDAAARQLLRRDEATGRTVPVLDGVTAFDVGYFADAAGREAIRGAADSDRLRVRRVRVVMRFAAANALLRVPDLSVAIDVAPPNLKTE